MLVISLQRNCHPIMQQANVMATFFFNIKIVGVQQITQCQSIPTTLVFQCPTLGRIPGNAFEQSATYQSFPWSSRN